MMAGADGNGKDVGGKVVQIRVPMLTITFDPRTYSVEVQGTAPTLVFGKAMCQMAADELERQIVAQRNQKLVELVSGDIPGIRG